VPLFGTVKGSESNEVFKITEQPVPLSNPAPENDAGTLQAIEQDIRDMLRRIADSELSLLEHKKQDSEKTRRLLLSIIEAMDAFDRVFKSIREKGDQVDRQMKKWIGNFRTIQRMLNTILTEQGVSAIENLDREFDSHWHKVAETVVDRSKPDGTITEELLKGYIWQNQILRKAEVIVVRNLEDDGEDTEEIDR
jgi:molecular chaperone GrpE (heat shock protein)